MYNSIPTEAYVACINNDTMEVVYDVIYYYNPMGIPSWP